MSETALDTLDETGGPSSGKRVWVEARRTQCVKQLFLFTPCTRYTIEFLKEAVCAPLFSWNISPAYLHSPTVFLESSVNRDLAALRRMFNLGARSTPPKVAMVPYIPMLAENNVRQGFFEHEEFQALHDKLPGHLRGFVTFGYKSGWRYSEITDLTWAQVDRKQGIVRLEVGTTKNKEARIFYLDEELKEVFREQFAGRHLGCPHVFQRDGGKIKEFRKSWNTACKEAKIGKRLFHDFRRTAVRNMVRAGIPERAAMMISGHKTRSVFDRYNIVNPEDLKQASSRMEAYLQAQNHGHNSRILE